MYVVYKKTFENITKIPLFKKISKDRKNIAEPEGDPDTESVATQLIDTTIVVIFLSLGCTLTSD